jgi:tRNA U34 2-thiouridine synthase MnmA/TrmU
LPLSDLTRKEVLKLAENFGIVNEKNLASVDICLHGPEYEVLIKKQVPEIFLEGGDIVSFNEGYTYGQHSGMFRYSVGDPYQVREMGHSTTKYIASYSSHDNKIKLADAKYFLRSKHMLINCQLSQEVSLSEPIKGFVHLGDDSWVECVISQKTLLSISLEFEHEVRLNPSDRIAVFKKSGRNSKILLTGDIQSPTHEGEKNASKIDPLLDF